MTLIFLKGVYQSLQIRLPLFFYKLVGYSKSQVYLTKEKLAAKKFEWQKKGKIKVFTIFSISNWESVFLDPLSDFGVVHHFSWPNQKIFFSNKYEWYEYHTKVNKDLTTEFDHFYSQTCNILVFIYASDFSISEATMRYLNRPNVLIVSFCWDDLLYFKGKVKGQPVGISKLSKMVDINLTMSPEAIPRYNFYGSPCFFWSAVPLYDIASDEVHQVASDSSFYVLFVGSKYGWRADFIGKLVKAGIDVHCYGAGWDNGPLSQEEMKLAIQKAPVTLGFANIGYTKKCTTIKGRDFEVPLYGGLYLTQYSEGLSRYYQPGKEVLTYRNFSECLKQLYIIKHNREITNAIRIAGHQKAVVYGSWQSRFAYLRQLINQIID